MLASDHTFYRQLNEDRSICHNHFYQGVIQKEINDLFLLFTGEEIYLDLGRPQTK